MAYDDRRERTGLGGLGSELPSADVVKGWWLRNSEGNSTALNNLVPFVQLIGIYSPEEIQKLTQSSNQEYQARTAVYVVEEDGIESDLPLDEVDNDDDISAQQLDYFTEKIQSKYIGLNIIGYDSAEGDTSGSVPGIVLATNQSQAGDLVYEDYVSSGLPKDSGGVGITDFQMDTGTKEFGNRRFKIRITVTDPQILNEQPEYLKLSSLQSKFLLIYGWSNPNSLIDWEGVPPPQIDPIFDKYPKGEMTVDVTQENTGGVWSAAIVTTTKYDFAFNEVGQLEASFTFMPAVISFLSAYRVPVVADNMRLFLGTGEQTNKTNRGTGEQELSGIFAGDLPRFAAGFGAAAG